MSALSETFVNTNQYSEFSLRKHFDISKHVAIQFIMNLDEYFPLQRPLKDFAFL
jgi:hypothetical protein